MLGLGHVTIRHALDAPVDGRGEEERLALLREPIDDRVELLGEAHREHLVGLVQDEDPEALGVEGAPLEVIEDAPGRPRDDLGAGLELADLALHRRAAVDRGGLDAVVLADLRQLPRALERQLPGRGEDQRLHSRILAHELVGDGDAEGARLAGPGAGLNDQVAAVDGGLVGGELNGRRVHPAHFVDGAADRLGQWNGVEGGSALSRLDRFGVHRDRSLV